MIAVDGRSAETFGTAMRHGRQSPLKTEVVGLDVLVLTRTFDNCLLTGNMAALVRGCFLNLVVHLQASLFHLAYFDPLNSDAPSAGSKRYSRMAVPKVFINQHLDSHRGGIMRPRINYTLVYVKRGVSGLPFSGSKKILEESTREGGAHGIEELPPISRMTPQLRLLQPTF